MLDELLRLPKRAALDALYGRVDAMLHAGHEDEKWPDVEALLADPRWAEASTTLLVGLLIITLAVRDRIAGRERIVDLILTREPKRGPDIVQGLT